MSETIKIRWQFFLEHGIRPIHGSIVVDADASDEEISEEVEKAAAEIIPSRVSWEKVKVTG